MAGDRLPFLKFYPGDWMTDAALRTCSLAARGLWIDVLAAMHANTNRRGYLELPTGKPMQATHIARIVGATVDETDALLAELESAGVFSRTDDGTIYSRRMVRDDKQLQDDVRNGKRGGNPRLKGRDNGGVNPPLNPNANPPLKARSQKSEARSQKSEESSVSSGSQTDTRSQNSQLGLPGVVEADTTGPSKGADALKPTWSPETGFQNISDADRKAWSEAYPACNLDRELAKMHAWLIADPRRKKKNYTKFINNWLSQQQDKGGTDRAQRIPNGRTNDQAAERRATKAAGEYAEPEQYPIRIIRV